MTGTRRVLDAVGQKGLRHGVTVWKLRSSMGIRVVIHKEATVLEQEEPPFPLPRPQRDSAPTKTTASDFLGLPSYSLVER